MGIYTQKPTWVVCQRAFALFVPLMLLSSCGSETSSSPNVQTGPTATLKVSQSPVYDFGLRTVNSINEATFTVSNKGTGPATEMTGSFGLSVAYSFKGGSYPGTDGTCTTDLEVGISCTVVAVFSPPMPSNFEAPVKISYHNGVAKALSNEPLLKGRGN